MGLATAPPSTQDIGANPLLSHGPPGNMVSADDLPIDQSELIAPPGIIVRFRIT